MKALLIDTTEKLRQTTSVHELVVDVPDALPDAIADPDKLGEVALNLISNAIKYSPQGGRVRVSAWYDDDDGRLVMSVEDQGIGIAKEDQAQLFVTFQRIHRPETQGVRGTGLGLYIVKGLLELMGGAVWVESELDQGSTFFVALPVEGARGPQAA